MKHLSKYMILGLCLAAAGSAMADKLVILHTNDTHSQIDPAADGLGGVARRKVLIDSVRAVQPNTLLIDAGDVVQGTLFYNLYRGEVEEEMMNALRYDLRILGNHEFDNGMESLAENLMASDALLMCGNYDFSDTPLADNYRLPWTYAIYGDKTVSFFPVNIDPNGLIASNNVEGMRYVDAAETAQHMAWYLKNIEGMDYVVAVTHIGYEGDVALAKASTDIDVIIGGHSHTIVDPAKPSTPASLIKNAEGRDVLVAQTGKGGRYLGEIVIDLDQPDATPAYRLIPVDSRLDSRTDGTIEELLAPYRASIDSLYSHYIATSAKPLPKDSHALLNFMADYVMLRGQELCDGIDLSIVNKGGLRNDLPKGRVSEGTIIELTPFFNRVQVIEISGRQLLEAFDAMAAANGNGVSDNVSCTFDPATGKCFDILISGKPINPDATYRVATNDYLAAGGDYMTSLADHTLVAESPRFIFEDLTAYFTTGKGKGKKINPSDRARMTRRQ